jgi:hypothetical protein
MQCDRVQKDFCGKKTCQILRIFFFEITTFRQWVPASCQNIGGFLKVSDFPFWHVAKFGYFLLWMIASLATSQKLKKKP